MPDLSALAEVAGGAVVAVSRAGHRSTASVGAVDEHSIFRIASLTKTFTAVATIRAAESAGVALKTPVLQLLPQLEEHWVADRGITLEHVLAQTSGLAPAVTGAEAAEVGEGDDAALAACRLVVACGSDRTPGERWEYYNGNYFLAGAVVAALGSCSYEDALEQLVIAPAGLRGTSFTPPTSLVAGHAGGELVPETGYPRARRPSGGLTSSASDLLTFAEHLLADERLLETVSTRRTRADDPMGYGFGWATGHSSQLYLNGRLGGYRTGFLLHPPSRLAAVALANDASALPAIAGVLSAIQHGATGDDLAEAIDSFAA